MHHEGEEDLCVNIVNFVKVLGIMNHMFGPSLVSGHTSTQISKTLIRS
jgi:hypothetical protein